MRNVCYLCVLREDWFSSRGLSWERKKNMRFGFGGGGGGGKEDFVQEMKT